MKAYLKMCMKGCGAVVSFTDSTSYFMFSRDEYQLQISSFIDSAVPVCVRLSPIYENCITGAIS